MGLDEKLFELYEIKIVTYDINDDTKKDEYILTFNI